MKLNFCIFFVTSRCNSACRFCLYKDHLNKGNDLSLEEVRRISLTMGRFRTLLFSGGEPFLRRDLAEIVDIFVNQNKAKSISIPTNGIDSKIVTETLRKILGNPNNKKIQFAVSVSIDAMEDLDKTLRGRADAFSSAIETTKELGKLKKQYKNLFLTVNSVFLNENAGELPSLMKLIDEFSFVDFHDLEVIRPRELKGYPQLKVDLELLKQIHLFTAQINAGKLKRKLSESKNIIQWFKGSRSLIGKIGYQRYAQKIKERFLEGGKNLFHCPAGESVCVIESDATLRLCELKEPVGNLREHNYDLPAVLSLPRAKKLQREIVQTKCNCTHACFIGEFINQELEHLNLGLFFAIIYYYFKFAIFERKRKLCFDQEKIGQ